MVGYFDQLSEDSKNIIMQYWNCLMAWEINGADGDYLYIAERYMSSFIIYQYYKENWYNGDPQEYLYQTKYEVQSYDDLLSFKVALF